MKARRIAHSLWLPLALSLLACTGLAGCERVMRGMYDQPKHLPATASPLFENRQASRPPPEGAVAYSRGDAAAISGGVNGTQVVADADAAAAATGVPTPPSRDLLLRGRQRYQIYCLPCHSVLGDGDGPVVRRGFPAPPSFHLARLRDAPDRHFYDVITQGYGVMYPYADRVTPADRWAIVAYVRALQLSQHADVAALPAALRERLSGTAAAASGVAP
jgi:mono/diheme cytochrome c family protein